MIKMKMFILALGMFLLPACIVTQETLSSLNVNISCTVSNCMGWCGCQKTTDFTNVPNVVRLRNQCSNMYKATYPSEARCEIPGKHKRYQLCLCKTNNTNCRACIWDSDNDLMCFHQDPSTSAIQTCQKNHCHDVSTICESNTPCSRCKRSSTTNRPGTLGPPFPPPPKHPLDHYGGAVLGAPPGGRSFPSSTPASGPLGGGRGGTDVGGGVGGDGGGEAAGGGPIGRTGSDGSNAEVIPNGSKHGDFNGNTGSKYEDEHAYVNTNHMVPHLTEHHTGNQPGKIAAIVACVLMLLISLTVLAIVIYKFRKHGRDRNQNDEKEAANGYATIGDGNGQVNGHAFLSRKRQFHNQMYDGAIVINQTHVGPPIPLSERPSRSPPPANPADTAEAYMVSTPLYRPSNVSSNTYAAPLTSARQNIVRGVRSGYMSLKNVKKPVLPWKGPHGERYNLEGYTELQVGPNKSNNASTTSMKRSASENVLSSHSLPDDRSGSKSLPSTLARCSTLVCKDSSLSGCSNSSENLYYYKLGEGTYSTDVQSDNTYDKCALCVHEQDKYPEATGPYETPVNTCTAMFCAHGDSSSHSNISNELLGGINHFNSLRNNTKTKSSPYYYKLQPNGEAVVTFIENPGFKGLNTSTPNDDIRSEYNIDGDKETHISQTENSNDLSHAGIITTSV